MNQINLNDVETILKNIGNKIEHFQNKKILISGGSGFLGSWICDVFVKVGVNVTCLDNFSSGLKSNIEHLMNKPNFKLIQKDICDINFDESFDGVMHFASRASPEDYHNFQIETLLTNSLGTKNALDVALHNKCKFMYSSTSEVYGDSKIFPTSEEYWGNVNPIGERSCYDEGKRYGEALCVAYQREHKLDVRLIRIFNTYGPRIRPDGNYGRALPRFVDKALKNETIKIFGDGLQTRSFCYVTDTISGILLYFLDKENHGVLNIGSKTETTINHLAETIVSKTNSKSKIEHVSESPDDPRRRQADISKAKRCIGWEPKISLESGLAKTIDWIKSINF